MSPFDDYLAALEAGDADAVLAALRDDTALRVAVHASPFVGSELIGMIFGHLFDGLFSGVRITHVLSDGNHRVATFDVRVLGYDGIAEGLNFVTLADDGALAEVTVFLRPLDALQALSDEMGRRLGGPGRADRVLLAALLFAALLTGNEVGTLVVVHPAARTLAVPEQIRLEQALTRRYLVLMPILMTGTVVTILGAAVAAAGNDATALVLAAAAYATMLAVTLTGNMALNVKTLRAAPASTDEAAWRALRRPWDRLHTVRVVLDVTGLVLVCATAAGS